MKILRMRASAEKLDLSKVSLWRRWKSDPSFPKAIDLGGGSIGFIEEELEQWAESRRITPAEVSARFAAKNRPRPTGRPKKIKNTEGATDA